jgi:hypothetical protein
MESDGIYYFNRCRRCNGLLTKLEIKAALSTGKDVCPCGSSMFGPTNPLRWEWIKPSVLKMCVYQMLGKLAPAPDDGIAPPVPAAMKFGAVPPLSNDEIRVPEGGEA